MNGNWSDESELDESSNRGNKAGEIDDKLKSKYCNQIPQQQRSIFIEPLYSQLQNHVICTNPSFSEIFLWLLESEKEIQNQLN